jgi:hypothetical protein
MAYIKMCLTLSLLLLVLATATQGNPQRKRRTLTTKATSGTSVSHDEKRRNKAKGEMTEKMTTIAEGIWGGSFIQLSITESGAVVEFDCAHGTVDQKIVPDEYGRFDVSGNYEDEAGGPGRNVTAADEDGTVRPSSAHDNAQAARYTGRITAQKMTLTITLTKTGRSIGTFTLQQGRISRLRKCL